MLTEKEYWYWLSQITGIGTARIDALLSRFRTPEGIFRANEDEIIRIPGFGKKLTESIFSDKNEEHIHVGYETLEEKEIDMVLRFEDKYPNKLKNIFDPPYVLYVKGALPDDDCLSISIVGSRSCSNYGKEAAGYIAKQLTKAGVQIISGLAVGVDTFAHKGALDAGGNTYGVLGCGVDICYPANNIDLFMNMTKNGGVLSELKPGTMPVAGNFPMRNRIISGLSDGIVVVEAQEKSGSLITVDMGLEQGKNIYAVPGRINDRLSKGCNKLIKNGAVPVTDIDDILDDFKGIKVSKNITVNIEEKNEKITKNKNMLASTQKIVYACLRLEPKHMEEVINETGLRLTDTIQALYELEEIGLIVQTTNNYYARLNDIW